MIGAERPRLVPTQWFRPGSPRLVLVTRSRSSSLAKFIVVPVYVKGPLHTAQPAHTVTHTGTLHASARPISHTVTHSTHGKNDVGGVDCKIHVLRDSDGRTPRRRRGEAKLTGRWWRGGGDEAQARCWRGALFAVRGAASACARSCAKVS